MMLLKSSFIAAVSMGVVGVSAMTETEKEKKVEESSAGKAQKKLKEQTKKFYDEEGNTKAIRLWNSYQSFAFSTVDNKISSEIEDLEKRLKITGKDVRKLKIELKDDEVKDPKA